MSKDVKSTYYDVGGIEVLDVIQAKLTTEQYKGYLMGNSYKYLLRCNWKGNMDRDLEKASNYTKWLSELQQKEAEKNAFTIEGDCDSIILQLDNIGLDKNKKYRVTVEEVETPEYMENFNEVG